MFYVYILEDKKGEWYTGFTTDLRRRLQEHNQGRNFSTKKRVWHCIYYEACTEEVDARRRELYFKTSQGRRAVRTRLQVYLQKRRKPKLH
ncbi:MAG: Excinuclease ABC subunit C [Parcubacteria group bacterium GW2011_GWA2_56_21]|nr:MAG: Excinuclease ABC subunit C [Parcubacteria group bacterium GW2011_GWA2_56_21]